MASLIRIWQSDLFTPRSRHFQRGNLWVPQDEKLLGCNLTYTTSNPEPDIYCSFNLDHLYSTPLTEEDIFEMVMAAVRKQLGETTRMAASKRRSFIRSTAKCVVGTSTSALR